MKNSVRAFIAVEMNQEVRKQAKEIVGRLSRTSCEIKWVEPENLHLTLKFLGDVSLTETSKICKLAAEAATQIEPFQLEMATAGAFPNIHRPRTIWLGCDDGTEDMVELQSAVDQQMKKAGFRLESRQFRPHLTLGRVKRLGPDAKKLEELLENEADVGAGRTIVDEIIVFSSELTREGPIYDSLATLPLG